MRCSLLLLLAACTGSTEALTTADTPDDSSVSESGPDTDPPAPRPALPLLVAATDEDPAEGVLEATFRAAPTTLQVGGEAIEGFAYNGQYPGPLLELDVGDTLTVHLDNALDTPTTIHWHGAGAPYEMDGVPWQRTPTAPGEQFTYTFPVERSGTFWYHPHFDTARQVDLGLYGMIVVNDPSEPAADVDLGLIFDSWGESNDDPHDHGLEGSELLWTVNGALDPVHELPAGSVVRLRLLNASNTGYLAIDTTDLLVLGTDQGVRTQPWQTDRMVLGPGDRAELMGVVDDVFHLQTHPYSLHGGATWGDPTRLLTLQPTGSGTGTLPSWTAPELLPTEEPGRTDITYTLQGNSEGGDWRINLEVFPEVTIAEVALGGDVIVEVRNLSPTHHPFHGHGHAYEVLSIDGVAPERRRIEDTLDVGIYQTVRLRFEATRAGDWMQHCHILPHADGGMMTVLRVLE